MSRTRVGCAGDGRLCWEKPYLGPTWRCRLGLHKWELNFYRQVVDHYHCLSCGRGADR